MNRILVVLKTLVAGYVITVIAMLVLAWCLYKFRVSDNVISIVIYVIYGAASFVGGFILAKRMQHNRLMWGALYGFIYFIILSVVAMAINRAVTDDIVQLVKGTLICMAGGIIGSII